MRAYQAQIKGEVESGFRYIKCGLLLDREFIEIVDLSEKLFDPDSTILNVCIHGTAYQQPNFRQIKSGQFPARRVKRWPAGVSRVSGVAGCCYVFARAIWTSAADHQQRQVRNHSSSYARSDRAALVCGVRRQVAISHLRPPTERPSQEVHC